MTETPHPFPSDEELREPWLGPARSAFFAGLLVAWFATIILWGETGRLVQYAAAGTIAIVITFALLARARQRARPL